MNDLPERLAKAIGAGPLALSGARIAPELSYGRHAGPAPGSARHAAVMLLLFPRNGRWHIPLTARPAALSRHGGQVSLPGGTIEPNETSDRAAVRELREELGVTEPVPMIGTLADSYVYVSNFVVTPWIGALQSEPRWQPNAAEVEHVVEMPLSAIVDPKSIVEMMIRHGPLKFRAPCYELGGHCIWGATTVILSQLASIVREVIDGTNHINNDCSINDG